MVETSRMSHRSQHISSQRSSQRSHGTSSSSSHESHMLCKDCCRGFVSFMCTQVGVGGLLVSYAALGAAAFITIEGSANKTSNDTTDLRENAVARMWLKTEKHNVLDEDKWKEDIDHILHDFQKEVVEAIKRGYEDLSPSEIWHYSANLMYCLSVFTMIGYGHMTPKTDWGRIATIFYAVFGIPLYIVYFMNMGKVFANTFKFLYRKLYRCLNQDKFPEAQLEEGEWQEPVIIVPSTACIWVMILYMMMGTIMFAEWEGWSYLDSCYFSFTSLSKIGIGDFVPGVNRDASDRENNMKLIINFMYLLVGMALIAMCYTLMKEEILLKLHTLHQEVKEKCFYCGLRLGLYTEEQPKGSYYRGPPRGRPIRRTIRRR